MPDTFLEPGEPLYCRPRDWTVLTRGREVRIRDLGLCRIASAPFKYGANRDGILVKPNGRDRQRAVFGLARIELVIRPIPGVIGLVLPPCP